MIQKYVLTLMLFAMLLGCGSQGYYVLSSVPQPSHSYSSKRAIIGIEKVSVPAYLYKREIVVAKSSSQIILLSGASWAEDLDAGLTHRLIGFIQKKFNNPNVHAYPWGSSKQPEFKVSLQVTRFIAQGNKVYLDANWQIENINSEKHISKLFSNSVPTGQEASQIVNAMDKAFKRLEEEIAKGLHQF